ncbi:amidohydrolase [Podospora didyma]|uniref:Amidohydrolase n=1 Tax=Podospora didyma TaxID=330526 RepID=A0AAE0N4U6_9PEZI|nr:amidohydrolase [Podospora didyma]
MSNTQQQTGWSLFTSSNTPIIDSHIHLWPASEQESLAFYEPDGPLAGQHSLDEYLHETSAHRSQLTGFVFVEADRKNDASKDWTFPLQEIAFAGRITAAGKDSRSENGGYTPSCLAIIPWAPMNLGSEKLEAYLAAAEQEAGPDVWTKVKGFRYLLQDKPDGTGLTDGFIDCLKLLGRKKFVFDVGVDARVRKGSQLLEAVQMVTRAHEGVEEEDKVVFIFNHLLKADLSSTNLQDSLFQGWASCIRELGKCSHTNMKLSGFFGLIPEDKRIIDDYQTHCQTLSPWFAEVLAAFGSARIMYGSDWPVCNVGHHGLDSGKAWNKWYGILGQVCLGTGLSFDDVKRIFGGTAREAYRIDG